jgi:hypothetical protein
VSDPAKYDQRRVLTSGVILAGEESAIFYDTACRPKPNEADLTLPMDWTLPVLENRNEKSIARKRLDHLLQTRKAAFVVVEARFDAYNRYKGPVPKDERLQELLKKGNARFGHQNCCRFRLAIQRVLLAEPAAEAPVEPFGAD